MAPRRHRGKAAKEADATLDLSTPQRLLGIAGVGKMEGKKRAEAGKREKASARGTLGPFLSPPFLPSPKGASAEERGTRWRDAISRDLPRWRVAISRDLPRWRVAISRDLA